MSHRQRLPLRLPWQLKPQAAREREHPTAGAMAPWQNLLPEPPPPPSGLLCWNQLQALLSPTGLLYPSLVHQTLAVAYSGDYYMQSPFCEGTGFIPRPVQLWSLIYWSPESSFYHLYNENSMSCPHLIGRSVVRIKLDHPIGHPAHGRWLLPVNYISFLPSLLQGSSPRLHAWEVY